MWIFLIYLLLELLQSKSLTVLANFKSSAEKYGILQSKILQNLTFIAKIFNFGSQAIIYQILINVLLKFCRILIVKIWKQLLFIILQIFSLGKLVYRMFILEFWWKNEKTCPQISSSKFCSRIKDRWVLILHRNCEIRGQKYNSAEYIINEKIGDLTKAI